MLLAQAWTNEVGGPLKAFPSSDGHNKTVCGCKWQLLAPRPKNAIKCSPSWLHHTNMSAPAIPFKGTRQGSCAPQASLDKPSAKALNQCWVGLVPCIYHSMIFIWKTNAQQNGSDKDSTMSMLHSSLKWFSMIQLLSKSPLSSRMLSTACAALFDSSLWSPHLRRVDSPILGKWLQHRQATRCKRTPTVFLVRCLCLNGYINFGASWCWAATNKQASPQTCLRQYKMLRNSLEISIIPFQQFCLPQAELLGNAFF